MRRTRAIAALVALAVGGGLLAACTDDGPEPACEALTADFDWATPSPGDDARFELLGPGWIAGDSTYSVELPDGRTVWLFSDSFIGQVTTDGTPVPGMAMVHNALVAEDEDGRLSTRTSEGPESYFADPDERSYYWVQDAAVQGDELVVFLSRTRQVGSEGFEWSHNAIARVSLPDLEVVAIDDPGPGADDVAWGAGVLTTSTYTYVYGIEDLEETKHLHLARVPAGSLTDRSTWEYRTADGWTDDVTRSARLSDGVANELSVSPYRDGYLMISSDTSAPFSPKINAWTACSPEGPWTDRQTIYETPESGRGQHFTYNAHGHPEISPEGRLLISYNVNTFDFDELTQDPTLYRPKFITLDLE
ncbi:DUF4185 domain-containing protein [Janibacter indicus]|uniref:DUF4185 domain-containing protein n=1 Tax=Janibacter indicus TaxID=857417 RepID=A0A7L9J2Z4_9MICO|nr:MULTISPECIES: DUF4185 domain-containing protein [Janibacter]MCW4602888.1 DUF4185 domain-containing protein [Janibacter hoylei]QOK23928.1 DUF4185 domain-containing protein [Janibacter indicus]